jgi:hypothetical protein
VAEAGGGSADLNYDTNQFRHNCRFSEHSVHLQRREYYFIK